MRPNKEILHERSTKGGGKEKDEGGGAERGVRRSLAIEKQDLKEIGGTRQSRNKRA